VKPLHDNEAPGNGEDSPDARTIKDGPFCWQSKGVLKRITEVFSESNCAASARSVYLALTELASDEQSETFTASKALIAHKAGVSVKTAETMLKGLSELSFVLIEGQRKNLNTAVVKAANSYTLLTMRNGYASAMRNEGRKSCVSDKVEESEKKGEESEKRTRAKKPALPFSIPSEYSNEEKAIIEAYHKICVGSGLNWLPVDKFTDEVRKALTIYPELDECRELFKWAVEQERNAPNRSHSKTLVRTLWNEY